MPTTEDEMLQPITDDDLLSFNSYVEVPQEVAEETEVVKKEGPDSLSQFDAKHRQPFLGLLFLGKLTKEVPILGHSFLLETPTENERLESGVLHKRYANSISSEIGWAAITVAAYLRKVDGSPLPEPIGPKDTGLTDRFNWVIENLRRSVIDRIMEQCLILDGQVEEIIQEMEKVGEAPG